MKEEIIRCLGLDMALFLFSMIVWFIEILDFMGVGEREYLLRAF